MKRILFLLWALLLTSIVIAGVFLWLLETTSGAKASINLLNTFTPIKISYSDIKGDLSTLELFDLEIDSKPLNTKMGHLTLIWSPLTAIFKKDVQVEKFTASKVLVTLAESESKSSEPISFENIDWRLPLRIAIQSALINDLQFAHLPDQVISKIALSAELENDLWTINQFSIEHPDLQAELAGQLSPFDQLNHSLNLNFQTLRTGKGVLSIQGNSNSAIIAINLPEQKTNFNTTVSNLLTNPIFDFYGDIDSPNLLNTPANFKFKGNGGLDNGVISLNGRIAEQNIQIDKLDYQRNAGQYTVDTSGVFYEGPFKLKAIFSQDKIHQSELNWKPKLPNTKAKVKSSLTRIEGAWDNLSIKNESQIIVQDQVVKINAITQLQDFNNLTINPSKITILDGEFNLSGTASLQMPLAVNIISDVKNLPLEKINPNLPTLKSGKITANWKKDDKNSVLIADLSNLVAMINSNPVLGTGQLQVTNNQIKVATLDLKAAEKNSIKLNLVDPIKQIVSIKANINDLGAFIKKATGSVVGDIEVSAKNALLKGQLTANKLQVPELLQIETLVIDASYPDKIQAIKIIGDEFTFKDYSFKKADLEITGNTEQHQIEMKLLDKQDRSLDLSAKGQRDAADYRLTLQNISANSQELGHVTNKEAVEISYANNKIAIQPFCLVSDIMNLCGNLQAGDSVFGEFDLTLLASETNKYTKQQVGTITLNPKTDTKILTSFQIDNKQFTRLNFNASLAKLAIGNQDDETVELDNLLLTANGENNNIAITFNSDVAGGNIGLQGNLSGEVSNPNIQASLKGNLPKLEDVSPLLISTDIREGDFLFELLINGTIKSPRVSGFAKVNNTKVFIPELGTTQNIALDIEMQNESSGTINGSINSGDGKGVLKGDIKWDKHAVINLNLAGNKLIIADTKSLSLTASPDLVLNYAPGKLDLTGNINIDRAFTTLASSGSNTSLSNDVVLVDDEIELNLEALSAQQLRNINITTEFINPARIEGFGLLGAVTGKLRITQEDSGPVLGNGQLSITGQYKAFGQVLQIESGRLNYVNTALDNPVIEFYASRQIADVKVGVRVTGRPNALISQLESSPAMREAEILNYLVLGKPPGAASEAESNQLAQAAVALALARSESGIANVAGKAGLSELSLTQELGGLALSLGKQLSPRLYIGYTMGFIEPISIAKVRYMLSSKWVIESEISDETRAILKYRFEKD